MLSRSHKVLEQDHACLHVRRRCVETCQVYSIPRAIVDRHSDIRIQARESMQFILQHSPASLKHCRHGRECLGSYLCKQSN